MMSETKKKGKPPPEPWAVLRGHESAVNAVALHVPPSASLPTSTSTAASASSAQPLLVSGDAGGAVWLWSLRTKRRLRSVAAHSVGGGRAGEAQESEGGVLEVSFVEDGRRVLSQGRGQVSCVRLWDTERMGASAGDGGLMATFPVSSMAFCKMAVHQRPPTNSDLGGAGECVFAVYGEEEGKRMEGEVITLWDVRADPSKGSQLRMTETPEERSRMGMCMCLRLFDGAETTGLPRLATSWENGHLYLWDLRQPHAPYAATSAAEASEPNKGRMHKEPPLAFDLALTADGCNVRGVSGGADEHLAVFHSQCCDVREGEGAMTGSSRSIAPIAVETRLELGNAGIGSVAIRHSDKRIFATGGWDSRVRVWDFKRPRPLAILKAHTGAVNCLAFSSREGDNVLVSGSADTRIACWSIY